MSPQVCALYRYPVKSAAANALDRARITARGIALDRRWMLVRSDGSFLTQRQKPRMARLRPSLDGDALLLEWTEPGRNETEGTGATLRVPTPSAESEYKEVEIWGDRVEARRGGSAADRWLSERLEEQVQLVYMPDTAMRRFRTDPEGPEAPLSFVDSKPFLLTNRASLAALNARLETPLPMNRFRPNIVVEGTEAFAEDEWNRIRIDDIDFRVVESCTRCSITTVDQKTGERGKEPLRTLADFRRTEEGDVAFGRYLVHESRGTLREGADVEVVS